MTLSLNPRRCGTVVAIDGRETWLIHNHLNRAEETFDNVDRDWSIRNILGVGPEFEYEVLSKEDWVGRRLVADRFRDRRAFICGDAAHLWMPYAGYGMNAGIADAANLAWLLAATLDGWASPGILDAYEAERLPITEQVSHFAMDMALKVLEPAPRACRPRSSSRARRATPCAPASGSEAYDLNVQQYCCGGLNFGYFYDRSPIILYDGAKPPPYTMGEFTPSTVPGCRAPHVGARATARSLYDLLGPDYTLLRFDRTVAAEPLNRPPGARACRSPSSTSSAGRSQGYDRKLVLVRTDQHIAWRGNVLPGDVDAMVEVLRGARVVRAQ